MTTQHATKGEHSAQTKCSLFYVIFIENSTHVSLGFEKVDAFKESRNKSKRRNNVFGLVQAQFLKLN